MMFESLDRKLARVAREIAAGEPLPKGFSRSADGKLCFDPPYVGRTTSRPATEREREEHEMHMMAQHAAGQTSLGTPMLGTPTGAVNDGSASPARPFKVGDRGRLWREARWA